MSHPRIGIGIIIVREDGRILVGKRKGSHAPYWSIPGGHLELGETFEETAIREVQEETGLLIKSPKVIAITNNLKTFQEENKHYISVCLKAKYPGGKAKNREPEKCDGWRWVTPDNLPQPHFEASEQSIACYLQKICYIPQKKDKRK